MIQKLLFVLFFVCSFTTFSQEITRLKISGKITASKGEDVEGINIYNTSSKKGTITSASGEFEINVAENDRVLITAMQFQKFTVIIDEGIIVSKQMIIFLNPVVNQLDEVLIRPFDLSGNIEADLKRINVTTISHDWDLSYKTLEFGYEFSADAQTSVKGNKAEEAYFNGPVQKGADVKALVGLLANVLLPDLSNKKVKQKVTEKDLLSNAVQKRFGNAYFTKTFNIPEEKVNEFIYYVEEKGIDKKLVLPENELLLINFLHLQSKAYLKQSNEN